MKSILPYLSLSILLVSACSSTSSTVQTSSTAKEPKKSSTELAFSIDENNDGRYEPFKIELGNEPQPVQGKEQWLKDFFGSIKYPAEARRNKVEGVVILDIEVDQNGKVMFVGIKNGVSRELDDEAKRAFISSTKEGYFPFIINGSATKFRMDIPVSFYIN